MGEGTTVVKASNTNRQPISASGFEAVADSAQGFQVSGMPWVAFDFLSQTAHKHINRPRSDEGAFFPNGVKQLITSKHSSAVAREIFEQPELANRRRYGFALNSH